LHSRLERPAFAGRFFIGRTQALARRKRSACKPCTPPRAALPNTIDRSRDKNAKRSNANALPRRAGSRHKACKQPGMRALIQTLFEAQKPLLQHPRGSDARLAIIQRLAHDVPPPILAHFLRLVDQSRAAVAYVRHGVCGQCHIRVPSAQAAMLASPDDVHICEHCGSYLILPAEEMERPASASLSIAPQTAPRRRKRSPTSVLAL
jgi:hypothetical protein